MHFTTLIQQIMESAAESGITYRLSGTGGHAASTVAGKIAGIAHFNDFLATKSMPQFDALSESDLCCVSLWQEYGTYVSGHACNKKNGTDLLSWGTAKQVLSGPKATAESKYPGNIMWSNQTWYSKIRSDVEATVVKRCIELGVPVEEKSEPVGRDLLLVLNQLMLKAETEQIKAIEYRAAINITFAAVGRGGEVGYTSFNLCTWNSVYQCLFMLWQEKKTNKQKHMNFFCDAKYFEIDPIHSLGCYFVVGAGSSYVSSSVGVAEKWLFPFLDTEHAARKISEYLRKLAARSDGLIPLDVTATALRVGGVAEVVESTGDVVVATIRGGWGGFLASVATILEYYIGSHHTLSVGGKAIAGWSDPTRHIHPPSCEPILSPMSTSEKMVFTNFLCSLFSAAHFDIMHSNLRPFAYCMFASIVQYLSVFVAQYGSNHVVVSNLLRAARQFNYSMATLLAWGKSVSNDWSLRNMVNVDKASDMGPLVTKLQEEVIALKAQNTELLQRADRADKLLDAADRKLDQILAILSAENPLPSPSNKRTRGASPAPESAEKMIVETAAALPPVPASALTQLRPASPVYMIEGRMPLFELYRVWYARKYTLVNAAGQWSAPVKQVKSAVVSTIKYSEKVMTQELRVLLTAVAPDIDDSNYATWNNNYTKACRDLVALVSEELNKLDGKSFQKVVSINAVGNRVAKV